MLAVQIPCDVKQARQPRLEWTSTDQDRVPYVWAH